MTRQLTPESHSARYIMREAKEEDVEAMVTLFNEFAKCKLYKTLYPGLRDPSQLSEVNRKQLVNWIHSSHRQLNVLVSQETQEVVAFCQWALDDSADLPYNEKYYQGPGSDHNAVASFLDAIGDYDDRLCNFGDTIYIEWLVISEAHRTRGLLAILLSWGWRYAVLYKRYILLDPIEETIGMWRRLGCVDLTGSKAQLQLNTIGQREAIETEEHPEEEHKFVSYLIGSKGKAHTTIQPLIFDLNILGKKLDKSKWMGLTMESKTWHKMNDIDLELNEPTEYILRA